MGKTKTMVFVLAGILFLTCNEHVDLQEEIIFQEETTAEPVPIEKNDRVKTVSYDQIPDVVGDLLGRLDKTGKGIRDGKLPLEDAILDLEEIKKVVNEGQNTNYTFALDVPDRPDHIYNLVVTKLPDGTVEDPMVIGYRMEPGDMEAFFKSGEDYSLFKSEFKYYRFDNFFNGSKGYSVGREEDCGGGTTTGDGGSSSPTAPGETFTHTYDGHTVTNVFSTDAVPHSYGYSISIRTQNAQVSTVSTVGTSGTVQISTPGPTGTLISHNVAPGTDSIGVTNDAGATSPESSCFTITEIGDGVVLITYHPCGGNAPQQKGATTAKEGDCGTTDGTFAVNTAAKAVSKLDYHLPGGLTGGQLAWFSDGDYPDRKYMAQDLVWHLLDNNKSLESVNLVLLAIDALMQGYKIINLSPLIKYPHNSDYESKYPKLTEYLKNQLPNVANIPKITNAMHEFTQLPLSQIQKELQWGEGPEVHIAQLDNYPGCNTCNEDTVGYFDKPENPNKIFLDIDYVTQLENGTLIENDNDAAIFFLGTTILHEYVHYGDYNNGFDYPGEEGRKFEIMVYGNNVQPDNARLILNKVNN